MSVYEAGIFVSSHIKMKWSLFVRVLSRTGKHIVSVFFCVSNFADRYQSICTAAWERGKEKCIGQKVKLYKMSIKVQDFAVGVLN